MGISFIHKVHHTRKHNLTSKTCIVNLPTHPATCT